MTEAHAIVNKIKICYETFGIDTNYPLFLVHGFGSKKEVFIGQVDELSKHFKVIRFDNRGAGKSDRPNEPCTMEMFSEDINGLMDFLKIDKAHFLGYSLGGMIVQNFVLKYPSRVNKLILINTLPKWPGDETGLKMYENSHISTHEARLKDPVKAFYDGATPGYSRKFKKMMLEDPKKKIHGLFSAEDLMEIDNINPATPQDIRNQTPALGSHDVLDKLHEITSETLIICASKDRSTPQSMNEQIHEQIPNSKFIIIEGAGHGSPKERAPEINKYIIDFLKS